MRRYLFTWAILLSVGTILSAQEQRVNVRTSDTQSNAALTITPQGLLVVWNSYYSSTGRSYDIMARRLDPNGTPVGGETQVNRISEGNQSEPAVAANGEGRLVIAWQGPGADQEDVYVSLGDCNDTAYSDTIAVDDDPNGRQLHPRVALDANGAFFVVWENRVSAGNKDICSVRGRRFDSSGSPLGPSLLLDGGAGDARYPDIAMDGQGNFVVAWLRDRTSKNVFARLFDPNGEARTEAFEVNDSSFSSITVPSVAMNKAGDFVIVWDGDPNRASDDDVFGRRYDPNGTPKGESFRVNAVRDGTQQLPRVGINDANEFVVVWQSEAPDANTATDVFAQRFDAAGNSVGEPLQLNIYVEGNQRNPDMALMADGSFVAVWESGGQDGSSYGIVARVVR
jgi:hypothetical protein